MDGLHFNNLIQAATVSVAALGGLLLWRTYAFRGLASLLWVVAVASLVNILEESGLSRDIYLISPMFVVLVGPATYLAALRLTQTHLPVKQWLHLLPACIALGFTAHVQWVIGVGTLWRIVYAVLTAWVLMNYQRKLDAQRSDADDYSYTWLVYLVVIMTLLNVVDLVRLNIQPELAPSVNFVGQGINNAMWLVAVMVVVYQLTHPKAHGLTLDETPENPLRDTQLSSASEDESVEDYRAIFKLLDEALQTQQWFLTPRLSLADVSTLSGIQSRDISRAINLVAGKSFNEYINDYRIERVCQQLCLSPKQSVTDIAFDAGFSSKASFNQVFKRVVGQTPSDYKRQFMSTNTIIDD